MSIIPVVNIAPFPLNVNKKRFDHGDTQLVLLIFVESYNITLNMKMRLVFCALLGATVSAYVLFSLLRVNNLATNNLREERLL